MPRVTSPSLLQGLDPDRVSASRRPHAGNGTNLGRCAFHRDIRCQTPDDDHLVVARRLVWLKRSP